jgi:hypothetical protein
LFGGNRFTLRPPIRAAQDLRRFGQLADGALPT